MIMKKSKYIFIIMSLVYIVMAVLYLCWFITMGDNLLFALSTAALLLSVSDAFGKMVTFLCVNNTYNADLKLTIDFLDSKISSGQVITRIINVRNTRENFKFLIKKKYTFCHPQDYSQKTIIKVLQFISIFLFIMGIATFIIVPFVNYTITNGVLTSIVTIFAFSAMTLCLYLDDLINEKQEKITVFLNEKIPPLSMDYNDFYIYFRLFRGNGG